MNRDEVYKPDKMRQKVEDYYGKTLKGSHDLKTSACCPIDAMPEYLKPFLSNVHPEVSARFYGCGSPIPFAIEGLRVVDIGCGTGRDCFILSQMIGSGGTVIGVDMTVEQLDITRKYEKWHIDRFRLNTSNLQFRQGFIEDLSFIEDNAVDVVVSNCVINLSADKTAVFREIHRILKPGGELFFSDVFSDRRIPQNLAEDNIMLGECLGGALYREDFRRMMASTGFEDVRCVQQSPIEITDPDIQAMAGNIRFNSATIRAFKLTLEDRCEDYGQIATYNGGMRFSEHRFILDDHHTFFKDKALPVCGNTADMLSQTRYASYFTVTERKQHFGLFDCHDGSSKPSPASTGDCC